MGVNDQYGTFTVFRWQIAQCVEHETCDLRVPGSSPTRGTVRHGSLCSPSGEMGTWHIENDSIMTVYHIGSYNGNRGYNVP